MAIDKLNRAAPTLKKMTGKLCEAHGHTIAAGHEDDRLAMVETVQQELPGTG